MTASTALTRRAGEFVASLRFDTIPAQAIPMVCDGFGDAVAVMLAAANAPGVARLRSHVLEDGDHGSSRLLLGATRVRPADAAWVNGTAAHAFDYDDIGLGAHPAHPSAVMVPAILATADRLGSSGCDMVTAYIAGYEVWGEVALREPEQHVAKGWHPTGVFGPLAAAAAVASLMRLDASRAAAALGIAASQASGLLSNYGSMTKSMHAGLAARAGTVAARLAALGHTAGERALEHPSGLLNALSPGGRPDLATPVGFGERWFSLDLPLGFKRYPVCYAIHRTIDATLALRDELGGDANDRVVAARVTLGVDQATLLHFHAPDDALEAKFSAEFAIAAALVAGRVGLEELDDTFVRDARVRALMRRVETTTTTARDPVYRILSPVDRVELDLVDGRTLVREQHRARGHPDLPMDRADHRVKFESCTSSAYRPDEAARAFERLQDLPGMADTGALPCTRH